MEGALVHAILWGAGMNSSPDNCPVKLLPRGLLYIGSLFPHLVLTFTSPSASSLCLSLTSIASPFHFHYKETLSLHHNGSYYGGAR